MTHSNTPHDDRTPTDGTGTGRVQRRTIVQGAAWTIPVVAVAVATPAAAASLTPTLEFVNGPYSVSACTTLDDVVIRATTDGTSPVPANTVVTVTLPAGLTFSDGSTMKPFLTDGNGDVILSGIAVTSATSTGTITATTGALLATSSVTVTPNGDGWYAFQAGVPASASYPDVPGDVIALGGLCYLTPAGDLYYGNTLIASGTRSAMAEWDPSINGSFSFVSSTGVAHTYVANDPYPGVAYPAVPGDAVPVGGYYFLTPSGDLYYKNSFVTSGVTSAVGQLVSTDHTAGSVTFTKGGDGLYTSGATVPTSGYAIPDDAVALGGLCYRTPAGDLYYGATLIASGTLSATAEWDPSINGSFSFVSSAGVAHTYVGGDAYPGVAYPAVPGDAVPVGGYYFLTPSGDLYYKNTLATTGVTSAVGQLYSTDHSVGSVTFVKNAC